jgi:Ca2+-binding RTX toxin-like protein
VIQNKIVVRFRDGKIIKGYTGDFLPTKPAFHITPLDAPDGTKPFLVQVADLKAVFFVKDLVGNPAHSERLEFRPDKPPVGKKIRVVFNDGEILVGTTQGYDPTRVGFFLVPADHESNNERCFVVGSAAAKVTFI